ncbi:MAG: PEGA domain-containing protein, partial [Patescibacteria group bacterium]
MVKTPFHRKILPWMFIIIFLMMAPAVIFYTSGYRWNAKKHAIERNGTLIIDTFTQGASIKLNGQQMPETTSVTLQNMSPGSYDIKLDLQDYHPWSKTLWIDPERVTFASGIVLWPQLEPEYVGES